MRKRRTIGEPALVTFFRGERSNEVKEIKRMEQKICFYYLMGGEMYRRTLLSTDAKFLGPKREFQVGHMVLRRADVLANTGKIEANWEGPYKVISVLAG